MIWSLGKYLLVKIVQVINISPNIYKSDFQITSYRSPDIYFFKVSKKPSESIFLILVCLLWTHTLYVELFQNRISFKHSIPWGFFACIKFYSLGLAVNLDLVLFMLNRAYIVKTWSIFTLDWYMTSSII